MLGAVNLLVTYLVGTKVQVLLASGAVKFVVLPSCGEHGDLGDLVARFYLTNFLLLLVDHIPVGFSDFVAILLESLNSIIVFVNDPVDGDDIGGTLGVEFLLPVRPLHDVDAEGRQEVDGLSNVVALGEAAVVCLEEGADEVVGPLVGLVYRDAGLDQLQWVHHEGDSVEEGLLVAVEAVFILNVSIKFLFVVARHHVPGFNSPLVVIIERVDAQVLDVPAEAGEEAAHVDPGVGDAAHFLLPLRTHAQHRRGTVHHVV